MIEIKDLTIKYNQVTAIDKITLSISKGDFVYLLGPNGGGKTTLIKSISGLIKPTSGSIKNTFNRMGYLPQVLRVKKNFPLSVKETIYTGFKNQKAFWTKEQKDIINNLLDKLSIRHLKDNLIGSLSGGELQRVLFARSLVNDPELLILDEPTSALDVEFKKLLLDYLFELNEKGVTVIVITHDLAGVDVFDCKNKVVYIDKDIKFDGIFCDFHKKFKKEDEHASYTL